MTINELALFAGAGGGILGGKLLGWRTVCAVEIEDYPRRILMQRQNDGILEPFPIWDDITTFDGKPWRRIVDVVSGGFPCQDISCAGKGEGITGSKSGLWGEMARIIGEVRPEYVFVENSPLLVSRGLTTVLGDFAQMGYDAKWCRVSAENIGAAHRRDRIWIVANTQRHKIRIEQQRVSRGRPDRVCNQGETELGNDGKKEHVANSNSKPEIWSPKSREECSDWPIEPSVGRVARGVAQKLDKP